MSIHDEELAALRAEVADLQARLDSLATSAHGVSRRGVIGGALLAGAALGGLAASPAAAATGGNLILGATNDANAPTQLKPTSGSAPKVLLLGNDTSFTPTQSTYKAAVAGWESGDRVGLYGYTNGTGNALALATNTNDTAVLRMQSKSGLPTSASVNHVLGEMQYVNGSLYTCVESGSPGRWAAIGYNPTQGNNQFYGTLTNNEWTQMTISSTHVPLVARAIMLCVHYSRPDSINMGTPYARFAGGTVPPNSGGPTITFPFNNYVTQTQTIPVQIDDTNSFYVYAGAAWGEELKVDLSVVGYFI